MTDLNTVASTMVAGFERAWLEIRRQNPEVPAVMFLIGRAKGRDISMKREKLAQSAVVQGINDPAVVSFDQDSEMSTTTQRAWLLKSPVGDVDNLDEVYIGGECLNQSTEAVFAKVLREAAILLAWKQGLEPLSNYGRYHNEVFWSCAVDVGLKHQEGPVDGVWLMELTPDTEVLYKDVIADLKQSILAYRKKPDYEQRPRTTKPVTIPVGNSECWAFCSCDPPRLVEGAKLTLERGAINCGVCKSPFKLQHEPPKTATWYTDDGTPSEGRYSARSRRVLKPRGSSAGQAASRRRGRRSTHV